MIHPIAILNTSIITSPGSYTLSDEISLAAAKALIQRHDNDIVSAIGHQATADILTDLLGVLIEFNRINFIQQPLQYALVFKLKSRIPEGVILSRQDIEEIGYSFHILYRGS